MWELPRALRWYLWAVYLASAVLFFVGLASLVLGLRSAASSLGAAALFVVLGYVGERATLPISDTVALSLATPVHVATILLFPPPWPMLIALLAALLAHIPQTQTELYKRAFNVAHPALVVALTGMVRAAVSGPGALLRPGQMLAAAPALALVLVVYYALDVGLLLGVLSLLESRPPWEVWWQTHRLTLLPEWATAAIGVLAAVAWQYDHILLVLVLLPALALRGAFQAIARAGSAKQAAEDAQARAEAAVRQRDDVLHAVSHDLKSPLTTIKGQAYVVGRRAAEIAGGARLIEGITSIDTAASRMMRLINELLDVARLQAGQQLVLEQHPTDLVALVRRVAAEYQRGTERHRINVAADAPELVGNWDAFRLERVLDNLLANAVKYSPEGGDITLHLSASGAAGPLAVLAVRDQGLGIPASDLPSIFERFHRASNVAGRLSGTGIGLAGVRQIVEQHGGSVAVASVEGAGTTVTIRLPLAEEQLATT